MCESVKDEFSRFTFQNHFRSLSADLVPRTWHFLLPFEAECLGKSPGGHSIGYRRLAIVPANTFYLLVARAHGSVVEIPRALDTRTEYRHRAGEVSASSGRTCCGQSAVIADHVVAHTLAAWSRPPLLVALFATKLIACSPVSSLSFFFLTRLRRFSSLQFVLYFSSLPFLFTSNDFHLSSSFFFQTFLPLHLKRIFLEGKSALLHYIIRLYLLLCDSASFGSLKFLSSFIAIELYVRWYIIWVTWLIKITLPPWGPIALAHSCPSLVSRHEILHFRDFRTFYPARYTRADRGCANSCENSPPRSPPRYL